jgi:hypothetical protein
MIVVLAVIAALELFAVLVAAGLIMAVLCTVADWALCDLYFLRKWWNERPR